MTNESAGTEPDPAPPYSEWRRSRIWRADAKPAAEIGQEQVASFVSGEVRRDSNIRIALEGPWGSGKTRILKLVRDELLSESSEDVVVAWYDPWKYSPDDTVLRRTLLDSVATAVSEQCPECGDEISRDRFYSPTEKVVAKADEDRAEELDEAMSNLWSILISKWRFYAVFAGFWTALFLAASWLENEVAWLGEPLSLFVGAAGAALLVAIVHDAVRSIQVVEFSPYVRFSLPKLDQIDQFESEYEAVLRCLDGQDMNLVVLVDDLDRCSDEEMRTVMSGLATYLETPHHLEDGRVSFVVAIDEPRLLDAMKEGESPNRKNILQKHFHQVVPVPIPTEESLLAVLDSTLEELSWEVASATRRRMANLIAAHGDSNLRILRAATAEAHGLRRYYEEVLDPQGIQVAERLVEDPLLRFRIAMIREVADSRDLRKFLSEPRIWLGKEAYPTGIPKELFDISPRFAPGELDPRPLLGLSPGLTESAAYPAIKDALGNLKHGKYEAVETLLEGYQAETLISFVSLLLSTETPASAEEAARYLTGLILILYRARDALDEFDFPVFDRVLAQVKKIGSGQLQEPHTTSWVQVAAAIGDEALEALFQKDIPVIQAHQSEALDALVSAAENGDVDGRFALQIHASILGDKEWQQLHKVALRLIKAEQLGSCEELHEIQIQCMQHWNYGQSPKGPPRELYSKGLIRGMQEDQQSRAAAAYQVAANRDEPDARDFVGAVAEAGWPTSRKDEDGEGDQNAD